LKASKRLWKVLRTKTQRKNSGATYDRKSKSRYRRGNNHLHLGFCWLCTLGTKRLSVDDRLIPSLFSKFKHSVNDLRFSNFSIYDIETKYPSEWEVRLKQGSKKDDGSVIFCPSKSPQCIYIGWGELAKAKSRFGSHKEQAEDSLKRMVKEKKHSRMGVSLLGQRTLIVNGHEAFENHFKAITGDYHMVLPFFTKGIEHEVHSVFLHCEDSGRFLVLVADGPPEDSNELNDMFQQTLDSLRCHI